MIALIDYDNLDIRQRRLGLRHVMTRLLQALGRERLAGERNLECRLYGGWFDEASLSPAAQQLLPEVQREFPSSMAVAGRDGAHVLLVRAALARALTCDPGVELTHTYRRRSLPPRLRCISTPFPNCAEPSHCPVASVEPFVRDGACPADGCVVTPGAVLERAEQKLVDSMITVDLVHLAEATSESLVVVSADDDLWPGIRHELRRAGFEIGCGEAAEAEPPAPVPDDDLRLVQRFLRGFLRATALNEGTIRQRLGADASPFFKAVLPRLIRAGVVEKVHYQGHGDQMRLRLSVPMATLEQAMSAAGGRLDRFVEAFR